MVWSNINWYGVLVPHKSKSSQDHWYLSGTMLLPASSWQETTLSPALFLLQKWRVFHKSTSPLSGMGQSSIQTPRTEATLWLAWLVLLHGIFSFLQPKSAQSASHQLLPSQPWITHFSNYRHRLRRRRKRTIFLNMIPLPLKSVWVSVDVGQGPKLLPPSRQYKAQ